MEELQQRAKIMLSGKTGAAVASGDGAATTALTYGLVRDVGIVIAELETAIPALFDRHAEHRPCGLLCKLGFTGMIIGDVIGLPLLPFELAEPIGKAASKLVGKIGALKQAARKKARRRGADAEEAAAAVLRRRVNLPLPTADEAKAATRRLARAARSEPPAAPPPLPTPDGPDGSDARIEYVHPRGRWVDLPWPPSFEYNTDIPGYRGTPGGFDLPGDDDVRYWDPQRPPCVPSDHRPARLFNSLEAAEAAGAASQVTVAERRLDDCGGEEERYDVACVKHKHALRRLRASFPEIDETHHMRPCPCGRGSLAMWPWVVQTAQLGFCECSMARWELTCWRSEWIARYPSIEF